MDVQSPPTFCLAHVSMVRAKPLTPASICLIVGPRASVTRREVFSALQRRQGGVQQQKNPQRPVQVPLARRTRSTRGMNCEPVSPRWAALHAAAMKVPPIKSLWARGA
eukprot:CAMPEP_0119309456 /NCGR_PEP_ID=MMETSP1333-20130426/15731_1 /TAXON_ID=418940 /ORGANISM="Scyphosphaera apsteinii, Strain RCC1455" /LENGTH=107 /DNA_ID=CAMNT_0007313439 /DNA_START=383 /DNA_END=706 /DNA_ORIENTATION=-